MKKGGKPQSENTPIKRRNFLKWSGVTAAGTIFGSARLINAMPVPRLDRNGDSGRNFDVAIIGAGVSGLVAARTLASLGINNVKVLEGRGRVGGRTIDRVMNGGGISEDGGQWIGPTQNAILMLMNDLGITKFPSYRKGKMVDDTSGSFGLPELLDYIRGKRKLDALAKTVPLSSPWKAPNAAAHDAMTFQEWMDANIFTAGGKAALGAPVEIAVGSPSDVSFLYILFYIHSGTDYDTWADKAEAWRISGGAQSISEAMADDLGDIVQVDARVDDIDYDQNGATIQYTKKQYPYGSETITAKKVIVAMMPADADRIVFSPGLPARRAALQKVWTGTTGIKVHVAYATPFWRDLGFSGVAMSDDQFLAFTADNSPEDASSGVIVGFVNDTLPPLPRFEDRVKASIASLNHFFGSQANQMIDYMEYDWGADPMSAGAVSALQPGVLTSLGPAIREPVGPIHWSGTETSEIWNGYLDGAVRAGNRAAEEVATLLP